MVDPGQRAAESGPTESPFEVDACWMRTGPFAIWPIDGRIRLGEGRISFKTRKQSVFDVRLDQVSRIQFPRYGLGGVVKFRIGDRSYRFTFQDMGATAIHRDFPRATAGDVVQGVAIGEEFKRRLERAGGGVS